MQKEGFSFYLNLNGGMQMNGARMFVARELIRAAKEILAGYGWQSDWKAKYEKAAGKNATFYFRNQAMKDLWEKELLGQISDGMWENDSNSHWEYYSELKTAVGGRTYIQNHSPNYARGFGFKNLYQYVGDRMMDILHKTEPNAGKETLFKYLDEISSACKTGEGQSRVKMEAEPKDLQRIDDMAKKAGGDEAKMLQLAGNMAKAITDFEKCARRADAAYKRGYNKVGDVFKKRLESIVRK